MRLVPLTAPALELSLEAIFCLLPGHWSGYLLAVSRQPINGRYNELFLLHGGKDTKTFRIFQNFQQLF